MLDRLRSFSKTWIAKILIAVLVVSFGAFGISNVITGLSTNVVARVGNEDISARDFQRAYDDQINFAAQQIGQVPTTEMAVQLGIPSRVISRLAAEAAVNGLGESTGIGVSDQRLGIMLRNDPTFGGTLGQFDPANFQRVLQQNGLTESEYFELQRRTARREQVALSLLGDTVVPKVANDILNRYSGDRRTIDYFVINEQAIPTVAEPTDEEIAAYFEEHKTEYRTVEKRQADLLVLTTDTLAATIPVSDEDITAEYERTKAQLVRPERRTIQQVALPDDAAIQAFEGGKAAGKTFETLVTELGLAPIDLGSLAQASVSDPTLATAAFSLAQGDYAVIEGIGGKRAVHVSLIEAGATPPLEEARAEIRQRMATSAARNQYVDTLDQIEELHAAGQSVSEIAERFKLGYVTVNTTASGAELTGVPDDSKRRVAQAIFAADPGALSPAISVNSNSNIWFDVKTIDPARDLALDEVRDRVVQAWTAEKVQAAIVAEVEKALEEIRQGKPIADVASALNQFSVLSPAISRQGDGSPLFTPQVASAVFAGGPDHYGSVVNGDGDTIVFKVAEVAQAEPGSASQQAQDYVANATRDSLYGEFTSALRDDAGLRINQQALNQLLALDVAGN